MKDAQLKLATRARVCFDKPRFLISPGKDRKLTASYNYNYIYYILYIYITFASTWKFVGILFCSVSILFKFNTLLFRLRLFKQNKLQVLCWKCKNWSCLSSKNKTFKSRSNSYILFSNKSLLIRALRNSSFKVMLKPVYFILIESRAFYYVVSYFTWSFQRCRMRVKISQKTPKLSYLFNIMNLLLQKDLLLNILLNWKCKIFWIPRIFKLMRNANWGKKWRKM